MAEKFPHTNRFDKLRKKAEDKLKKLSENQLTEISVPEAHELLHELHTHQIELELQNEELRFAQIELSNFRRRFSDLYDFAPVGYLTISNKGLIVEANLTAGNMFGIERSSLIMQRLSSYILPEDQDIFYQSRQTLLKTREKQSVELRMTSENGLLFYAQLTTIIDPKIDGELGQFRVVIIDITSRKKVEQAIIKSKKEWLETFDATKDFITIQDNNHRILRANKAAHDLFGASYGELDGKLCYELLKGTSNQCQLCLSSSHSENMRCYTEEFTNENLGKTLQMSSSAIRNDENQVEKIVHVGRDITKQKAIEEELLQSKKMEATITLASGVAHNFNNILTAVIGNHELALRSDSLLKEEREYIEAAHFSARRAAELAGMMFQFVGQKKTLMTRIEINSFIEKIIEDIKPQIKSAITVNHHTIECFINSDIDMIREMIDNLIINADEAIVDSLGEITLDIHQKHYSKEEIKHTWQGESLPAKEYVSISVRDNGQGMEKEVMNRAFDPFFSRKFTGRGLGLPTVLGIVRAHRGSIQMESVLEKGTTVKVLLPAVCPEKISEKEHLVSSPEPINLTGKVLAVDDDPILLKLMTKILHKIGLEVLPAEDGLDALEIFAANKQNIDLVLMDIAMPKLDGLGTIRKIREESDVPVIIISGYSLEKIYDDFSEITNCSFLQKPFNFEEFKRRLQEMLI